MKITEQSTLAELEWERQRLGITHLLVTLKPSPIIKGECHVAVATISDDGTLSGAGGSIHEAIADAFAAREQQIAGLVKP